MSKNSYYLMYRGWSDGDCFADEIYTEREAFHWLISNAVWQEKKEISIKGNPIILKRGQLSYAIRFMASAWGWHRSRVARYIEKLKKWQKIETNTETGQIIITLCNYNKYQDCKNIIKTRNETRARQERDKSETNNNTINTRINTININGDDCPEDVTPQTWQEFKELRKKKKAPVTNLVISRMRTQAQKANWSLEEAVQETVYRGWQSFNADWVEKKGMRNGYQGM